MPKLSVVVITRNEAAHISSALASVAWADEIVVVDSHSTDDTVALASRSGARVLSRPWDDYASQRNFGATSATHDWIFFLDADERVTPDLAAEIQTVLRTEPPYAGYRIPRLTQYLGRWIRSTDWYPDLQLRLYHRRHGAWTPRHVHESVRVNGQVGRLRHPLHHFGYDGVSDHVEAINRYTSLAARQMYEEGRRSSLPGLVTHPSFAFFRNYVLRGGFRDGAPGLIVSLLNSYYTMLKLVKLWQLQSGRTDEELTNDK